MLATREILYTPPTLTPAQLSALDLGPEVRETLTDVVVDQYLFILSQCTVPGMGRYRMYMQEVLGWLKEGLSVKDVKDATEEQLAVLGAAYVWARVRASCKTVKKRTIPVLEMETSPDSWENLGWPKEWESIEGFLEDIPDNLVDIFAQVTEDLNPGLWNTRMDDKSKKVGSVSVR